MNLSEAKSRFEELDVARAMGDISSDELAEFNELSSQHGFEPDPSWGTFLSSVENALADESTTFTSTFTEKVVDSVEQLQESSDSDTETTSGEVIADQSKPNNIVSFIKHPACGWIAACVALVFALVSINSKKTVEKPDNPVNLVELRTKLINQESTLQLKFSSPGDSEIQLGDVVWNSDKQEGYMKLSNIKVNDPSKSQYQLWIVDPKRDSKPVDGGVFDLSDGKDIIVPIKATLPIDKPDAFVITEEKPGGVVVSDQKRIIAIAAPKES